jgi:hypothetical protein
MGRRLVVRIAAVAAMLALVAGLGPKSAGAASVTRLDLAAMTLDGNDLPDDALLYVEQYLTPGQLAGASGGAFEREELADAGLRWFYESRYVVPTEDLNAIRLVYRSYVEEYHDADGAEAGFAILEDESRAGGEGLTDEEAPEVGEEPREVTTGTVPAVLPEGDEPRAIYDLTFRVENVIAGVSIEAVDSADVDPDEIEELAGRLVERIEAVLSGEDLPGIDLTLPDVLLPLDARLSIQEGYQTAEEAPYATADPGSDAFETYESGYAATYALNLETNDAAPEPYVSLALSTYEGDEGPRDVLDSAGGLQSNLLDLEEVEGISVDGADEAVGFRFSSPATETTEQDSFRVLLAVGDRMLAVDVQGAESVDAAQAAALDLAEQQIACLEADGLCETVDLPAELGVEDEGA